MYLLTKATGQNEMKMYKNVTEWINANDDIGVLCREGVDVYYSYPIGGEYKEIEAPAFSDDVVEVETEVETEAEDFKPEVETIGWITWDDNMRSRSSKIHLTTDRGESTLCGTAVPNEGDGVEVSGCSGHGYCKKCQAK